MIEIYLFVNPIGPICYQSELTLLDALSDQRKKIQLHILPIMNLHTVGISMDYLSMDKTDLDLRNQQTNQIYEASLDYKAAQLQGRKIARDFLLKLQCQVGVNNEPYSPELVKQLFAETNGDLEMFLEDRASELIKQNFAADQSVAREMGISMSPSAVVYNFGCERDYGVLLEGMEALRNIPLLCKTDQDNYRFFYQKKEVRDANVRRIESMNRRLVLL
ncbi:DsbA family protein [Enterococcus sp.]|jgi:predicted DsbA family dithiol-disulfide isomerase|uniref:DsbA family protein n=1 Tax=Enterococcus sp. TaxID=35783 RepID=UPI0025B917AD|nr:DsbA family protein [Enterococcus sp.]